MVLHFDPSINQNKLLVFYPNGAICIYENILSNQKKCQLSEILQCDYENLMGVQIVNNILIGVSNPSLIRNQKEAPSDLNLVCISMTKLSEEIAHKRNMANKDTCIVKLQDMLSVFMKGISKPTSVKLSDMSCSKIEDDILCFMSFNTGHVVQFSLKNYKQTNQVFSLMAKFGHTEVFEQALRDADIESLEVLAQKESHKLCKVTCLDFLKVQHPNQLGLLLLGDQMGFVYVVQSSCQPEVNDNLLYMNQTSTQESKALVACKWIADQDCKFSIITGDGDLLIYSAIVNREEELCDSIQVVKLHSLQTFEELPAQFLFSDVNQIGNNSLQVCSNNRSAYLPDTISILWPARVLRKHDISRQGAGDKIITQSNLHNYSVVSTINELTQKVIMCSSLNSNGACFLSQMSLNEMVPQKNNEFLTCPKEHEFVFYIDSVNLSICSFSNITGEQKSLFEFGGLINCTQRKMLQFTQLQMRWQNEQGICKFLIAWMDPVADNIPKKHQFTWVTFNFKTQQIVQEMTNKQPPKNGQYPTFLTGTAPFNNLNEAIVCLLAHDSFSEFNKLIVYQFDPFIDTKEITLAWKVRHIYATPFRQGKAIMFYNVQENLMQFSKNRMEKNSEDDLNIYSNRKFSFQLSYDEHAIDIRWYNITSSPKALIATNQRMYIVDKNLAILQNFSLEQHQSRLRLRSISVTAQTILFSTETHLHYLTQEKGSSNQDGAEIKAMGTILSFPQQMGSQTFAGALSDRVLFATEDKSQATNVRFNVKAISMLEPLLLGYLSSLSQSKLYQDLDRILVQRCLTYLDSNQVSSNLLLKLNQLGLKEEQNFLVQNPGALQFSSSDCDINLQKLFPTKQLQIPLTERDFNAVNLEDRNDTILKLQIDPAYSQQKKLLMSELAKFKSEDTLNLYELTQQWQKAIQLLKTNGRLHTFIKVLEENNQQDRYKLILKFARHVFKPKQSLILHIEQMRYQTWLRSEWSQFLSIPNQSLKKPVEHSIPRIKLAYNESLFSWQVREGKQLFEVVSENMANWMGFDCIVQAAIGKEIVSINVENDNNQEEIDVISELTSPDDIEEAKHVIVYLRCDEGTGCSLNDVTDNNLHAYLPDQHCWSQMPLEEGNPLEFEDKWGKSNSASYSVQVDSISVDHPLPLKSNFTIEFWCQVAQADELQILSNFNLKFNQGELKVNGEIIKLTLDISLRLWTHIAVVHSTSYGVCLFVNGQPACSKTKLTKPLNTIQQSLVWSSTQLKFTEVRIWNIALNERILQENYKMPLALLNEQKRKIKVNINKKSVGVKKSLGLALKKQVLRNYETNVIQESSQVNLYKTQIEQVQNSDFLIEFGEQFTKPEVAVNEASQSNFFDFETNPKQESPVKVQQSDAQQNQKLERITDQLKKLQFQYESERILNLHLCEAMLMMIQVYHQEQASLQEKLVKLANHVESMSNSGYLSETYKFKVAQLIANLRFASRMQEAISKAQNNADKAGLSNLLFPLVSILSDFCQNQCHPVSFLAGQLREKILSLNLIQSLKCNQFATLQRIALLIENSGIVFEAADLLNECNEAIERDKEKNMGVCLNYAENEHKCPQCISLLPFGPSQTQCFDCLAKLQVCHRTLSILVEDEMFALKCKLCSSWFSKQWLEMKVLVGQSQLNCPECLLEQIII